MNVVEEYRTLAGEVADTVERAARAVRAAEETHANEQRLVDDRLEAARVALASRREALVRATETVRRTDEVAERVWRDVHAYVGRRIAKRLPTVPDPRPAPAGVTVEQLLAEAKELVSRARRGEWSPDPMKYGGLVAILTGAIVAASVFGVAKVVLGFGSEGSLLTNLVAQLAVFLSPFAGIPLIGWGMARFRGQRTDVGTVGLTVLGGLVVSCILTFLID